MSASVHCPTINIAVASLILACFAPLLGLGQTVKVGEPAPDFSVPLLDGKNTVRLGDFRGRRVLVFTWASW